MEKFLVWLKRVLNQHTVLPLITVTIIFALTGCFEGNSPDLSNAVAALTNSQSPDSQNPDSQNPYQEVFDAGITKYAGTSLVQPSKVTTDKSYSPPITVHHYSTSTTERGPICMSGSEFFIETRDGSSDQLLMFLEGGGVCLSEICLATPDATLSLRLMTLGNLVGIGGVLNHYDDRNPMADFNVVHIPYCDGTIFMGDIDRPLAYDPMSSTPKMAYQRGLQNLTAGFEVAKQRYPHPSRIVLAGTSGGGYGIMVGMALARYYFPPETPIVVIADSGAPMLRDNDKDFVRRALVEINAIQYVPLKSCPDCIDNGHVSKIVAWALERDNNLRVASMSHTDDFVIGDFFMKSPPPVFRNAMLRETADLVQSFPGNCNRFITLGRGHTYLLDVFGMDVMMNLMGGFSTGLFDFPKDMNLATLYNESLGGLSQKVIDQSGKKITGFQWITNLLNDPDILHDVVDIE